MKLARAPVPPPFAIDATATPHTRALRSIHAARINETAIRHRPQHGQGIDRDCDTIAATQLEPTLVPSRQTWAG